MNTRTDEELEQVVSADGTPIAVWRSGAGPPLVLIHGTAADHNRWAPVLPGLGERYTVLTIDRRGRGGSGDVDRYALEREFEDVVAVVEWAGADVDVLGHSYGGICALEAALLTDRIGRLVLYEPPLGFMSLPDRIVERIEELDAAGDRDGLVAFFMREVAGLPDANLDLMRAQPAWEARVAAAHTIPREDRAARAYAFDPTRFRDLRVPTLFLLGGDSPAAFRTAAEAAQAALPDCRIVVLPDQRHAAMDTATDLFVARVLGFLEGRA